jgi:DNA repair protein RadC
MDTIYDSATAARRLRAEGAPRPEARERLVHEGAASLSDAELLAALIGTGTRGKNVVTLAEEVLALVDDLRPSPEIEVLRRLGGMGEAKACAVAAALEFGRRIYGLRERRIVSPRDIWPIVAHWADRKQERFICCSLNGAHEVIAARVVSMGLVNRTVVHAFLSRAFILITDVYRCRRISGSEGT